MQKFNQFLKFSRRRLENINMSHIRGIGSNFLSSKFLFSSIDIAQLQSIEVKNLKTKLHFQNESIDNRLNIDDDFLFELATTDTNLYLDVENTRITCSGICNFIKVRRFIKKYMY